MFEVYGKIGCKVRSGLFQKGRVSGRQRAIRVQGPCLFVAECSCPAHFPELRQGGLDGLVL